MNKNNVAATKQFAAMNNSSGSPILSANPC